MPQNNSQYTPLYWLTPLVIFPAATALNLLIKELSGAFIYSDLNLLNAFAVLLVCISFYKIIREKSVAHSLLLLIPYTLLCSVGVFFMIYLGFIIDPPSGLGGLALPIFTLASIPTFAVINFVVFLLKVPITFVNEKRKSLAKSHILLKNLWTSLTVLLFLNIIIFPDTYRRLVTYQEGFLFWRIKSIWADLNLELIILFFSLLIVSYLLEFYFGKMENSSKINKIQFSSSIFFVLFFLAGIFLFNFAMYKDAQAGKLIAELGDGSSKNAQPTSETRQLASERHPMPEDLGYVQLHKVRDFLILLTYAAVIGMSLSFTIFTSCKILHSD